LPNSLAPSNQQFLSTLRNGFIRLKLTLSLYSKLIRLLFVNKASANTENRAISRAMIVASDFLPSIHGGVYRPLSWLRFALAEGLCVELLTNTSKRVDKVGEALLGEQGLAAQIHYCNEADFQQFSRPARLWLARPEFVLAALDRLAQLHQQRPISHIIATGPDFSSFAIAAIFANKHCIPLHLDYRDEWTQSPFEFSAATKLSRLLENACINLADSISMTTQSQLTHFSQHFGINQPLFLKQNGCDNFLEPPLAQRSSASDIRLSHSGSIGGHNSLAELMAFLNTIQQHVGPNGSQIHLEFCGYIAKNQEAILQAAAQFTVSTLGQLSPAVAFSKTANADLCVLLIDQRYDRYLPGKLFSYIATGKPILILGAINSTEIASLCNEYAVPYFFADYKACNIEACAKFIANARHTKTEPEQLKRFRANMARQKLAKQFFDIFQQDKSTS
jgi:hypothetical protein